MKRSRKFQIAATAAISLVAGQAFAEDYPFVGRWNCEVGTFAFTNRSYHNGTQTMWMSAVEFGKGNDFRLVFPGGYAIALLDVTRRKMTWSSPASGDVFSCKRI